MAYNVNIHYSSSIIISLLLLPITIISICDYCVLENALVKRKKNEKKKSERKIFVVLSIYTVDYIRV